MVLDPLINLPNRIPQHQREVQAMHGLVHTRMRHAKLILRTYYTVFAVGMAGTAYGVYSLIRGKPASE